MSTETHCDNFSQNGYDWVFCRWNLEWYRRMQHTRDHAVVDDLGTVLGFTSWIRCSRCAQPKTFEFFRFGRENRLR